MLGDGDVDGHRYTTASKKLADDFSEICFKLGKSTIKKFDDVQSSSGFKNNGVYRIYIANKYFEPIVENNIIMDDYDGYLYCVEVPKYHIVYVRRNGKAHWSGNTYGERLEYQIEKIIEMYKNDGYGTNQACMSVSQPSDIDLADPPCVLPDTSITTSEGFKRADEINEGDYVLTHKGSFKRVSKVYSRMYNGDVVYLTIKGFDYGVQLTTEHPVFSVKADFCPYDKSLLTRCKPSCKKQFSSYEKHGRKCPQIYEHYNKKWCRADEIDYLHYVPVPLLNTEDRNCPYNDSKMYFFGLFLAEGDYLKDMSGIRFNLGSHELHLHQQVQMLSSTLYGVDPTISIEGSSYRLNCYSKSMASEFYDLFGKGARHKSIPMEFIHYNNDKLWKLLEGYIDGDGYERDNQREFFTTSEELSNMFKLICQKLGVIPAAAEVEIKDGEIDGRIIKANGPGYYFNIFNEERHRNIYWQDNEYMYVPLKFKHKYNYSGHVYNYEVEDDNSYIAGGIPVHNCLRSIDTRISEGKLHFQVYFRSWDLWNGFPANLGAIQLLKEYMAGQIGVEDGEIIVSSKGLHLYDYIWELAKLRANK